MRWGLCQFDRARAEHHIIYVVEKEVNIKESTSFSVNLRLC